MRRLHLAATAALALAVVAAAPVVAVDETTVDEGCRTVDLYETPEDPTDDVELCESQQFVAAGEAPVSNLGPATFTPDEPTAPVGGLGVGGSVTDIPLQGDPAHGLEVTGTFTGAVDSVDVEVYFVMPNGETNGSHGVTPQLEIDGFNFGGQLIDAAVSVGDSGVSKLTFRIDNMLELWPLLRFDTGSDVEHTLRLNLSPYYIGDDGAYLYGGTEVPSNVVLNAEA